MRLKMFLIVPLALLLISTAAEHPQWKSIENAIASGNAQRLSTYFASTITLTVPGHKGSFSSKQARAIMSDFFRNNPPRSFNLKSSGTTARSAQFFLGTYEAVNGSSFAVYVLLEPGTKKATIAQITFEKT